MQLGESTLFRSQFEQIGDNTIIRIDGWLRPIDSIEKGFFNKFSKSLRQLIYEIRFDLGCKGDYIVNASSAKGGLFKGKHSYYEIDITLGKCDYINKALLIDYMERFLQGYKNIGFSPTKF